MKNGFWSEIGEFFARNIVLITSLIMGTAAKIAIDSRIKKLSKKDILIKVVLSFFAGYLSSIYMTNHGWEQQSKWAVPLITLLGESIVMWIMANSKRMIENVVYIVFPNKNKQDKKN